VDRAIQSIRIKYDFDYRLQGGNRFETDDVAPKFYPFLSSLWRLVNCSPFLGHAKLELSPVLAHETVGAGEPFVSVIGGLLPIALCGLTAACRQAPAC
jgi:hypothetical protein